MKKGQGNRDAEIIVTTFVNRGHRFQYTKGPKDTS